MRLFVVATCGECPFAATDVDGVMGHHDNCQHPHVPRKFKHGEYRADVRPVWCALSIEAVLIATPTPSPRPR